MEWLAKVAASALVRRLVYLAIAAVIAWAGMGQASAQTTTTCSTSRSIALDDCDNGETARAAAVAAATSQMNSGYNYGGAVTLCTVLETPSGADPRWYSRPVWQSMGCSHGGFSNQHYRRTFSASAYCATGNEWDAGTQTCNPAGPTDEECQALNLQPGFIGVGETSRSFDSKCMANGCMFEATGARVTVGDGTGQAVTAGQFEWTGACPAAPAPDAPTEADAKETPEQTCTTEGQGDLKLCVKRNGEHCLSYPAGTGKQQCWTPGEVGEKTSGEFLQKRNPGTQPDPPSRSDVTQVGTPKTTTTTKQPQNTTVTTTITNYITNDGTDAGATDDGEPADGSGDDDEEQDGSVADDGTCDAQPVVSGGDPLLANIILQTWGARCAQADDNAITTTGGAIDDCNTPWAITGGTDANVAKLQAMRRQICPFADDASAGKGEGDYGVDGVLGGTGVEAQTFEELWGESLDVGGESFDDSGLAGFTRACPQMPVVEVMGVTVDFNVEAMCNWMKLGGQLVLIMATLAAFRIQFAN